MEGNVPRIIIYFGKYFSPFDKASGLKFLVHTCTHKKCKYFSTGASFRGFQLSTLDTPFDQLTNFQFCSIREMDCFLRCSNCKVSQPKRSVTFC